jgi:hypothetical protein
MQPLDVLSRGRSHTGISVDQPIALRCGECPDSRTGGRSDLGILVEAQLLEPPGHEEAHEVLG